MKTLSLRKEDATHDWFIVDASDKILGRLATKIADRIRGKDKPTFTPHTDGGDYVIVINADKIKVTGNKLEDKKYYTHTLYPGGLKTKVLKDILETKPEYIIEEAVKGMLPKNKLGKQIFKKLKVFKGSCLFVSLIFSKASYKIFSALDLFPSYIIQLINFETNSDRNFGSG